MLAGLAEIVHWPYSIADADFVPCRSWRTKGAFEAKPAVIAANVSPELPRHFACVCGEVCQKGRRDCLWNVSERGPHLPCTHK
jgi:hypothetical protein